LPTSTEFPARLHPFPPVPIVSSDSVPFCAFLLPPGDVRGSSTFPSFGRFVASWLYVRPRSPPPPPPFFSCWSPPSPCPAGPPPPPFSGRYGPGGPPQSLSPSFSPPLFFFSSMLMLSFPVSQHGGRQRFPVPFLFRLTHYFLISGALPFFSPLLGIGPDLPLCTTCQEDPLGS